MSWRREAHLQLCGSSRPFAELWVGSGAVSKPGGDAAGQDALHSAGVEGLRILGLVPNFLSLSGRRALMCLLQHCICVSRPCEILSDVNAEELKAVYPLHRVLWMVMGVCSLLCLLNPPPAPWSCRCWVRGGSPDTILSGCSPPLCRPSHRCRWSGLSPLCHQQLWRWCWSCVWLYSHALQGVQEWAEDAALRSTSWGCVEPGTYLTQGRLCCIILQIELTKNI